MSAPARLVDKKKLEEMKRLMELQGEVYTGEEGSEVEEIKELQREVKEIVQNVQGKLAQVETKLRRDYDEQMEQRAQFERSYGKGTVAVIRGGPRSVGVQEVPPLPPEHLRPHGGRFIEKKEPRSYDQKASLWDYEGKPPEGHRTKRRK